MTKAPATKVFVSFHCEHCDDRARVSVLELIHGGVPWCSECDCDMDHDTNYVEIE